MRRAVAISLLGLIATPEISQGQEVAPALRILMCKMVQDSDARLKCYDDAVSVLGKLQQPTSSSSAGQSERGWEITESKSPIDDSPQVSGMLLAEGEKKSAMFARCKENKTEVYIAFQDYLGSSRDRIKVLYRVNDATAVEAHWHPSTGGQAVFVLNAIAFIKSLPDDAKLFVRAFDFRGNHTDATFKLSGISELRARIALTCKWPEATTKSRPDIANVPVPRAR